MVRTCRRTKLSWLSTSKWLMGIMRTSFLRCADQVPLEAAPIGEGDPALQGVLRIAPALPLTAVGKIDRRALAALCDAAAQSKTPAGEGGGSGS